MNLKTFISGFTYFSLVFIILPFTAITLNNRFSLPRNPHLILPGILFLLGGALLFLYCAYLFSTVGKGTPVLSDPPKKLVARGPYYYTRNPLYIAQMSLLLGYACVLGHALLFVYAIIMLPFYHAVVIFIEEPGLRKRLGSDYILYTKKVPRWLPRIPPK